MLEYSENDAINIGLCQPLAMNETVFRLAVDDHIRPESRNMYGSPCKWRKLCRAPLTAANLTPDWLSNNPSAPFADKAMHHALMARMANEAAKMSQSISDGLELPKHINVSLGRLPSQWSHLRLDVHDTQGENPHAIIAAEAANCLATAWMVAQPLALMLELGAPPRLGIALLGGSIIGREEVVLVPTKVDPVSGIMGQFLIRSNSQSEPTVELTQVVVQRLREVTQIIHDICLAAYCARSE